MSIYFVSKYDILHDHNLYGFVDILIFFINISTFHPTKKVINIVGLLTFAIFLAYLFRPVKIHQKTTS